MTTAKYKANKGNTKNLILSIKPVSQSLTFNIEYYIEDNMTRNSKTKGPNYIHPEKASAVGSRNSINRDDRNEYEEAQVIIDEQIDKIINHISAKLPPEVLEKIHVGGTVKEVLHSYLNQGYQNMFNRYLVTAEDEMAKKFRNLVDKEEARNLNNYTAREVPDLLESIGGVDRFNSGPMERSIANIFGHLQGHVQKGVSDVEHTTNKLLREKSDVGAFVSDNNSYSIVKCYLKDNPLKPETVNDISLGINIIESELLKPIYHYQAASEVIIKDIVSQHILKLVDKEVDVINSQLIDENQDVLTDDDAVIEKLKKLEDFISFDDQGGNSPKYDFVAEKFLNAIQGLGAEVEAMDYDPLSVKENVYEIVESENTRNNGFNSAVKILTSILDHSQMGYQHIENFKNTRRLVIREYADVNPSILPDERFSVTLTYYDDQQLREMRTAYCQQLDEFKSESEKIWKVYDKIFHIEKQNQGIIDFEDVAAKYVKASQNQADGWFGKKTEETLTTPDKLWNEISFITPERSNREKMNETLKDHFSYIKKQLSLIRDRLKELYHWDNPSERIVMEQRLDFLEDNLNEFCQQYNPFHLQAGLVIEIKVSTIKRKEITMNGISLVLTDFINRISRGFSDQSLTNYQKEKMLGQEATKKVAFTSEVSESIQY